MLTDLDAAELSALAYSEPTTWQRGDVCAIRRDNPDGSVDVAFKGTSNAHDAIRDAKAWPSWDRDLGWCHHGFLTGARSVAPQMMADLAGRRVNFMGHSLGGDLAILVAAKFVVAGHLPRSIITFNAARLGWWKLRRVVAQVPTVHLWRLNDDVVSVAPFWLLSGAPLVPLKGPWALDPLDEHPISRCIAALKIEAARHPAPPVQTLTRAAIERPSF